MGLSLVFPPARRSPLRLYADLPRASAVDKVPEDPLGDEPGRLAGGKEKSRPEGRVVSLFDMLHNPEQQGLIIHRAIGKCKAQSYQFFIRIG